MQLCPSRWLLTLVLACSACAAAPRDAKDASTATALADDSADSATDLADGALDAGTDALEFADATAPLDTWTGGCVTAADCAAKEDGNPCNGTWTCVEGTCVVDASTVVVCTGAEQACQTLACDPGSGQCTAKPTDEGKFCDDGVACTANTLCASGKCAGGLLICKCQQDADCAKDDDGDPCNGTMVCDKSGASPKCVVSPVSVVTCPVTSAAPCLIDACDPKSGQCIVKQLADQKVCDDGDPCTASTVCAAGKCQGGTTICACKQDADCVQFDDPNLCNGGWICDKSGAAAQCKQPASTVVTCSAPPSSSCAAVGCNPATGQCQETKLVDGLPCDDGDGCSVSSTCKSGVCQGGVNICQCVQDSDCAKVQVNPCLGTMGCDKSGTAFSCKIKPGTAVVCTTGAVCSVSACNAKTGACNVAPAGDGDACDDGDPCTIKDACQGGKCAAGGNACKCSSDADCQAQDDNLCDGLMGCNVATGKCVVLANTAIQCGASGDPVCGDNQCDPKSGECAQSGATTGKPCDDGDTCTQNDHCTSWGGCKGSSVCECKKAAECNDGDDCTVDGCNAQHDCTHAIAADGTACGLLGCGGVGKCKAAQCVMPINSTWFQTPGSKDALVGAVASGDGGFVVAGWNASQGQAFVRRYDPQSLTVWTTQLAKTTGYVGVGLALRSDGTLAALASGTVSSLSMAGVVSSSQPAAPAGCDMGSLVDRGPAGLALSGYCEKPGVRQLAVVLTDASGKFAPPILYATAGQGQSGAITTLANGGLALAGWAQLNPPNAQFTAVVQRTDAAGTPLWQKNFPAVEAAGSWLSAVVPSAGGLTIAGSMGLHAWLARLDDSGNILWQQTFSEAEIDFATGDGTGLLVALHMVSAGRIARLDGFGNVMWKSDLPFFPKYTVPKAVVRRVGGGLAVAGALDTYSGFVGQTDPWGHVSCGASGNCGGFPACDDSEACTADSCTAGAGCTHVTLADGSMCAAGKACAGGVCQ